MSPSDSSYQDGAENGSEDEASSSAPKRQQRKQTGSPDAEPARATTSSSSSAKLRKRTKTGCLTCRKRRVKCGEERPTCLNCQKSKRHCEGYTQRVIFKSPVGNWPSTGHSADSGGVTTLQYHSGMLPGSARMAPPPALQLQAQQLHHPDVQHYTLASPHDTNGGSMMAGFTMYGQQHSQTIPSPHTPTTPAGPLSAGPYTTLGPGGVPYFLPQQPMVRASWRTSTYHEIQFSPGVSGQGFVMGTNYAVPSNVASPAAQAQPGYVYSEGTPQSWWQPAPQEQYISLTTPAGQTERHPSVKLQAEREPIKIEDVEMMPRDAPLSKIHGDKHPSGGPEDSPDRTSQPTAPQPTHPDDILLTSGAPEEVVISNPNDLLQGAAVEAQDDDYFDVDEADVLTESAQQEDLSLMQQIHGQMSPSNTISLHQRPDDCDILGHYHAEWHASPLRNPRTARVFAHFVHATAPIIHVFERSPTHATALFGAPSTSNLPRQSLWTVSMPMRALHNHGLLHAMLALASLHIALLQGADATPSLKHYSYALRSVHAAVGNKGGRKRRHAVETLAATLLLGYYEVMNADHAKWCSHLLGAKQLLLEIGYPTLARHARQLRVGATDPQDPHPIDNLQSTSEDSLVSTIVGWRTQHGHVDHVSDMDTAASKLDHLGDPSQDAQIDLETYNLYQDLWWWWVRQDAYQSIVSGNSLLLSYARWSDCPPRGQIGRLDAPYGTHDHLMLLLGRIAAFSAKDRRRKVAAIKASGSPWRPPPGGMFEGLGRMPALAGMSGSSGSGQSPREGLRPQTGAGSPIRQAVVPPGPSPPPPGLPPTFMGMAPVTDTNWMHPSYENPNQSNAPSPTSSDDARPDDEARLDALREWTSLRSALNTVGSHLGPTFQPVSKNGDSDQHNTEDAPFGPPIYYRNFAVGVLIALWEMCHMILFRAHPSMPPASMIAAGVAAPFTRESALRIGRIATGIWGLALPSLSASAPPHTCQDYQHSVLHPSVAGEVCEITMPLFFSGVQYQAPQQRRWFADRFRQVELLAGFASAGMIGHGCETAWRRAAAAGRGPPYERRGHWGAPDEDDGDDGRKTKRPPWSVGVRGGEGDVPPPLGFKGLQERQEERLPVRIGRRRVGVT